MTRDSNARGANVQKEILAIDGMAKMSGYSVQLIKKKMNQIT